MTDEIVTSLLGLSGPQAFALKVGAQALNELLRHPTTAPDEPVAVLSSTPGRLRLRAAALKRSPAAAARVEARLASLPGVRSVEANPLTGTVLVTYAEHSTTTRVIKQAVEHATAAFRVIPSNGEYRLPRVAELALSLI